MEKVITYKKPTFAFSKWDWEKDSKHRGMLSQGWKAVSIEEKEGTSAIMQFFLTFCLFPVGWLFIKEPTVKVTYDKN